MIRPIIAVGAALALTACGTATSIPSASAPAVVSPAPSPPPAVETSVPAEVTIRLAVHSVPGDFGSYIVNLHDGDVATQTTFDVNSEGEWSKTITVPNTSMVKLDIARIGATCEIAMADTGEVLVREENSCIVGS